MFLTGPPEEFVPEHLQGTTVVAVAGLWAGDVDDGAEAIAPFRDLAPEVDLVGPMPYADFQCMIDDPPGLPATTGRPTTTTSSPTRRSTCS